MEELQDAIEDAQYMNAVHDSGPKPTKEWKFLTPEKLSAFIEGCAAAKPNCVKLEHICARPLGLYMYTKFTHEKGYGALGDFIMEVAKYRTVAPSKRLKVATKIKTDYLMDNSTGRANPCTYTSLSRQVPTAGTSRDFVSKWRDYVHFPPLSPSGRSSGYRPSSMSQGHVERGSGRISVNNPVVVVPISNDPQSTPRGSNHSNNSVSSRSEVENAILVSGMPVTEVLTLITEFANTPHPEENRGSDFPTALSAALNQAPVTITNNNNNNYNNNMSNNASQYSSSMPISVPMSCASSTASVNDQPKFNQYPTTPPRGSNQHTPPVNTSNGVFLPKTLFDSLDMIVYNFLEDLLWSEFKASSTWEKYWQFLAISDAPVGEEDFALFRVLGRGGFGLVSMCKRSQSGKLFAMKVMNKKRVKLKRSEALCLNERNLLAAIDSPFVVCLKFAFTTPTDLYLIVDLMMGGDLGFHLHRKNRFPLNEVKYFAARTLMGVLALHEKDIIYRDLKPENILMDNDGYTRISDLGLATYITKNGLTGTCGTRGYWAPEMLRRDSSNKREKYHKQADFFSYGCVVYEFIVGVGPFRTQNARQWKLENPHKASKEDRDKAIDTAICEMEPEFDPTYFKDSVTTQFLSSLLCKHSHSRLGAGGGHEIMYHPFFKDIDWEQLARQRPPWKPARNINMSSQQEIGSFNDERESNKIVLLNEDHAHYDKWGFVNMSAFEEELVMYLRYADAGKIVPDTQNADCCTIS